MSGAFPDREDSLERASPTAKTLRHPAGWALAFAIFLVAGVLFYSGEAYLALVGAFPEPVLIFAGIGYLVWLLVMVRSWERRGR